MEKTDTRTLLVLKAIKLFKERGVDNVSTMDIVRGNNIKWVLQMGRVQSSWRCEEGSGYPFPSLG